MRLGFALELRGYVLSIEMGRPGAVEDADESEDSPLALSAGGEFERDTEPLSPIREEPFDYEGRFGFG
jgi:hypothetical protein